MYSVDFTPAFKHTQTLISPDGKLLVSCIQHRLIVKDLDSTVLKTFSMPEAVSKIIWSPNSEIVACLNYDSNVVYVHSINLDVLYGRLDFGTLVKVSFMVFSPNGGHLLIFLEHQLQILVFGLEEGKIIATLPSPKFSTKGFEFRIDGEYFAYLQRIVGKDVLCIHDVRVNYKCVKAFQLETTDADNFSWSGDGKLIAVWDYILQYKVLIYSPDGRLIGRNETPKDDDFAFTSLGIKNAVWSPSNQFLAIGGYDHTLRLLNGLTFNPIIDFVHTKTIKPNERNIIYREVDVYPTSKDYKTTIPRSQINFDIATAPVEVAMQKYDEKTVMKFGISAILFNTDGTLMAVKDESMSNVLWIYNLTEACLCSTVVLKSPLKQIFWHPKRADLLMFTAANSSFFYSWSFSGCIFVEVPVSDFNIKEVDCNPHTNALLFKDKHSYCIGYQIDVI